MQDEPPIDRHHVVNCIKLAFSSEARFPQQARRNSESIVPLSDFNAPMDASIPRAPDRPSLRDTLTRNI